MSGGRGLSDWYEWLGLQGSSADEGGMTTSSQSLEPPGQGPGEGLFLPADDLEDAQNMMDYANQQRRSFRGDATTEEEVFQDYDDMHATDEQEHGITGGAPLPDTPVPDEATTTQPDTWSLETGTPSSADTASSAFDSILPSLRALAPEGTTDEAILENYASLVDAGYKPTDTGAIQNKFHELYGTPQEDESNPVPYKELRAALKDDTYDLSSSELESAWDKYSRKTGGTMSDDDLLSYIKQTTQSTYDTIYGAPTSTDTPLGGLDDNNNSDDTPPSTSDTPPASLPEQPPAPVDMSNPLDDTFVGPMQPSPSPSPASLPEHAPAPVLEHNQYHLNQREAPAHVHQDIIYDERDAQSLSGYKRSTRRHARVGDIAILAQFS